MSEVLAAVFGFVGGAVGGLLGVGGGVVFVPALAIFLGLSQVEAEATSLLAMIPVAALGAYPQHRYGNLRPREGIVLGMLAAGGAVGGAVIANVVSQRLLEVGFGLLALVIATQLVRGVLRPE